ncbi:PREDICTED: biorientation of chromosomes in cell division protein 1-like 1 isoform X2 [Dinoponera quadriceps]|uniref:Biorientation of chromosomes in cell division protein 1-like 1 isoform X2 n=1 Tax=Dinoponera quadriceps TaxID=609295 RepID=A0A6P3XGJ7_DINQU|nr:PREDICTED: biorientation of chromosomes in cell division protein 1-like 1 isoform X2 [Dinoponera quadriceps]
MELDLPNTLLAGDTRLIDHIVGEVKSQGIFDQFRKECIADVDTKPAYQNLRTRVEGSVNSFLSKQTWKPDLNKNQLRETLRKHIHDAPYLDAGVERIVDQVVNPKVYSVFMPQIEDVVYKFLGIEKPKAKEKNDICGLKDLLPKDLDPVSPESDKNSLKDLSLESVDTSDNLNEKEDDKMCNEYKLQNKVLYIDKDNTNSENGHVSSEEKTFNEVCKTLSVANMNLNISGKSDDKMDEEEEDSPTFEPIDIMNLNESNISNDSHLSGISELTSHRSKSPDFSNELSRDNFDCSNQDSQLSKVSSDSRLSIVTDFGSNHGFTPVLDTLKDETMKDKYEAKNTRDNFRAIREFDLSKNKAVKNNFEFIKCKDTQGYKDSKSTKSVSRENSRDATDSGVKDKYEYKSSKEKAKDNESIKLKSTKEKISSKDVKYPKDKSNEKKKVSSHSDIKYDKHSKSKSKEKIDQIRNNFEKTKDNSENIKENANKLKDEKIKETDKKDNVNKEAKDLKDLYKEKIRELREKKELTEKEKLNKDKLNKETKDKKDSSKDRKSNRKEHKSSSSSKNSSVSYHENKNSRTSAEKVADSKDKRTDMKDKVRREEKRLSKDSKSKTHFTNKTDLSDKSEKYSLKRTSRGEKEDKTVKADTKKDVKASGERINGKKNTKNSLQNKTSDCNDKLDSRKDLKNDSQSKDKKRRDEKKSKTKDDHSSLRKNSNDRRSTDRDGSNGSNSKTSQSNNSYSNATSQKSDSSSLTKENEVNNSNSETLDNVEEMQMNDMKLSRHSNCKLSYNTGSQTASEKSHLKIETDDNDEAYDTQEEIDLHQMNLPLKKRHLYSDEDDKSPSSDIMIKKPKFAKNVHEAKKLMKIRKQMDKQKVKEDKRTEKNIMQETEQTGQSSTMRDDANNLASMPDHERVQIIEIPDEEYDEPYPEKEFNLTLDERSIIMLGADPCARDFLDSHYNKKATLSNMELCIRESLSEIVSNISLGTAVTQSNNSYRLSSASSAAVSMTYTKDAENLLIFKGKCKDDSKIYLNDKTQSKDAVVCVENHFDDLQMREISASPSQRRVTVLKESEFTEQNKNAKTLMENMEVWDYHRAKTNYNNEEVDIKTEMRDNEEAGSLGEEHIETCIRSNVNVADLRNDCMGTTSFVNEDNEDCCYFKTDNARSEKFSSFLESLELVENSSLEDIIESLGGKVVSSAPKSMTFPKPKRSSSPLLDLLVNNSNNNNDGHKQILSSPTNEDVHGVKKRKLLTTKKPRLSSFCNTQGISNGENFVMPLSPDSDVSATSEKTTSSNVTKEEKRNGHQRRSKPN